MTPDHHEWRASDLEHVAKHMRRDYADLEAEQAKLKAELADVKESLAYWDSVIATFPPDWLTAPAPDDEDLAMAMEAAGQLPIQYSKTAYRIGLKLWRVTEAIREKREADEKIAIVSEAKP